MDKCGRLWEIIITFDPINLDFVITLTGTYECKADAKGRLKIVAPLTKQLAGVLQDGFILKRSVFQECIELYPMPEWNKLSQKINKLNRFKKKNNDFIRLFYAGVKTVEMDSNGRLLIPKDLMNFAGINKNIVLSSAVNIIEIWDKDKYEQAVNSAIDDFASLAEEVMGTQDDQGEDIP